MTHDAATSTVNNEKTHISIIAPFCLLVQHKSSNLSLSQCSFNDNHNVLDTVVKPVNHMKHSGI